MPQPAAAHPTATDTLRGQRPSLIRLFKVVAIMEACSWLGLLIGMYFKWIAKTTDLGVRIFGAIHGGVFVAYVVVTILVARRQRWPLFWTTALGLGASIPPFFTLWFEHWAARTSRLDPGVGTRLGAGTGVATASAAEPVVDDSPRA